MELLIKDWKTPVSHIPPQQIGNYKVSKTKYPKGNSYKLSIKDSFTCGTTLHLTQLQVKQGRKWKTLMIDSPVEVYGLGRLARRARGRVLVGGLGLGIVVHQLTKIKSVGQILVVEISSEVIDVVKPYLPNEGRVEVVCEDFFKFVQSHKGFDTIITDMWTGYGGDPEVLGLYYRTRRAVEEKYPEAIGLYHGYQHIIDLSPGRILPKEPVKWCGIVVNEPCLICGKRLRNDFEGICLDCVDKLGIKQGELRGQKLENPKEE